MHATYLTEQLDKAIREYMQTAGTSANLNDIRSSIEIAFESVTGETLHTQTAKTRRARRSRREIMDAIHFQAGMRRVRGNLGGTYYE